MKTISLFPLQHRDQLNIALQFPYDPEIKNHVKKLDGIKWSQSNGVFYIPLNTENKKLVYRHLRSKGWFVDVERMRGVAAKVKRAREGKDFSRSQKKLLHQYVAYLRGRRLGESTVKTYYTFVLKFVSFNTKPVETLITRDFEIFMEEVIARNSYSISSHRQCLSALKHFAELFLHSDLIIDGIDRPKKSRFLPTVLSKEEVVRLLQATRNLKHRAILALIYSAGLRIGELLHLSLDDIDVERRVVHVRQAKGRKDRYAMLAESILPLLRNYLTTYTPKHYFVEGGEKGNPYSSSSVRAFLQVSCTRAGIKKKVTPHTLRHSFATHMLENGVGLRHIQELLGHSKPETTMLYTHVAQKDLLQIQSPLDVTVKELMDKRKDDKNMRLSGE